MSISNQEKTTVIKEFGLHESDTGSTEVQVAILTHRIRTLTEHFKLHRHDHQSRRGLLTLVGKRKSLMKYLKRVDLKRYQQILKRLELRK
jgi:small subunit ribosomal protein S15